MTKKVTSKNFIKYAFFLLGIVCLGVLSFDVYLSSHGQGVCPTSACKVAAQYGRYGASTFPILGVIFLVGLLVLFFLYAIKDIKLCEKILWLLLLCGLSFDGVLIGYLLKMHIFCVLCIGVALSLTVFLVLYSLYTDKTLLIILGICLWLSSFTAINFLKFDISLFKQPDIKSSVMIYIPAKGRAKYSGDLFVSLHCIHCFDVLYNLAKKKTFDTIEWKIHFLGNSKEDMVRIAHMLQDDNIKQDPFGVILKYKLQKKVSDIAIPSFVKGKLDEARNYFVFNKFRGIPLLIVRTPEYESRITGDTSIGRFLMREGIVDKWYVIKVK